MRPIDEMLKAAQGKTRFHMPGHKGRSKDIPAALDMTELPDTDDLYAPQAGIRLAERLAARSADAAETVMLTGGATAGVLSMFLCAVRPGETVLFSRDAHLSAHSACILGGFAQQLVPCADDLLSAIEKSDARAVFVTRPTYSGHCADLGRLVARARKKNMRVLVDEAHGAHFNWWDSPESAMRLGADFSVQSAHKTLGALTGGAWLHMANPEDALCARAALRTVQSSSPSFLTLRSLDDARDWMDEHGQSALLSLKDLCARAREHIGALDGLFCPQTDDPTRLFIDVSELSLTGAQAYDQLFSMGVALEAADRTGVIAITSVFDTAQDFDRLVCALSRLRPGCAQEAFVPPPAYGNFAVPPREAFFARHQTLPLGSAAGMVSARAVGLYPPGSAIVAPGERFTARSVDYLLRARRAGFTLFGLDGQNAILVEEGIR